MKVKKVLIPLLLLTVCVLTLFCSCVPKTTYDNRRITKIETTWTEGFAPFSRYFARTFDFETNVVFDTWISDLDDVPEEVLQNVDKNKYNNPMTVTSFSDEQKNALYDKIKSLGFLAWKGEYVTKDVICDGGSQYVKVYFADGLVKSTYIYYKYPPKYDKIKTAFEEYLGAYMYCE